MSRYAIQLSTGCATLVINSLSKCSVLMLFFNVALFIQSTWRSNDYVNAFRLVNGYSFYRVSGRQNIYNTWITNTTVSYHKHVQPPCFIIFHYHIRTLYFQQYNPNNSKLNMLRHWQLFLKVSRCLYLLIPYLLILCFTHFTSFVVLILIQFYLHNLVYSPILLFDAKPICYCIQLNC